MHAHSSDTTRPMREYRCGCGKLLFKGAILLSTVEVKCPRCGSIRDIRELNNDIFDKDSFGLLFDEQGKVATACQNAELMLGYDMVEFQELDISGVLPAFPPGFYQRLIRDRVLHQALPVMHSCAVLRTKQGSLRRFEAAYSFPTLGDTPYFFAVFGEPSESCTCESIPRELEEFCGEGRIIFASDADGVIVIIDERSAKQLGYAAQECIGMSLASLCPAMSVHTQGALDLPHSILQRADGTALAADCHLVPRHSESGEYEGHLLFGWMSPSAV